MFSPRLKCRSQDFLDDNDDVLRAQDRKQRNRIFQAIHQGELDIEIDLVNSPTSMTFYVYCPFPYADAPVHFLRAQER
jgi:hypothetical protein